jgi:hypothetical protein
MFLSLKSHMVSAKIGAQNAGHVSSRGEGEITMSTTSTPAVPLAVAIVLVRYGEAQVRVSVRRLRNQRTSQAGATRILNRARGMVNDRDITPTDFATVVAKVVADTWDRYENGTFTVDSK